MSIVSAPAAYIARCRSVYQRTTGAVLAPLSAFLLLQGIETVALRVERHVENARSRRGIPARRPARRVGQLCRLSRQSLSRAGAEISRRPRLLAADLRRQGRLRGRQAASTTRSSSIKRLVNIGDAKSLACHPASTTHRQMSPEEQRKAGVRPETIRLSIGIEHIDDIIADLDQALAASQSSHRRNDRGGMTAWKVWSNGNAGGAGTRCVWTKLQPARRGALRAARSCARRRRDRDRHRQQHARRRARADRAAVHRIARRGVRQDARCGCGCSRCRRCRAASSRAGACSSDYAEIGRLWDTRLDGLIVTGTEPRAAALCATSRTGACSRELIDWAERQHDVFDLVVPRRPCGGAAPRRHRAPAARGEVLRRLRVHQGDRSPAAGRRAGARAGSPFALERPAGRCAGGRRLRRAHAIAARPASTCSSSDDRSLFVFLQGHPEYDPTTLLREYRRDVGRFLRRERDGYPA